MNRLAVVGLVAVAAATFLAAIPSPAQAGLITVPMTVTPNPVVVGQRIRVEIYVGAICQHYLKPFSVIAVRPTGTLSYQTIFLGSAYTYVLSPTVANLYTNVLPVGRWEISASSTDCEPSQNVFNQISCTAVILTVKSKPAPLAPVHAASPKPVARPSPSPSRLASPSSSPEVSASPTPSPVPAGVLASSHSPSDPSPVGAWVIAAVIAAGIGVGGVLLYRRKRRRDGLLGR